MKIFKKLIFIRLLIIAVPFVWQMKGKSCKHVWMLVFFSDNIYIEVDGRYKDIKDDFVPAVSWWDFIDPYKILLCQYLQFSYSVGNRGMTTNQGKNYYVKTLPALLGQGISRVENQQIQVQEVQELNPGHIIGRQVLSPPCQPCSQCVADKPWSAHAQYQDKKMCSDLYILLDVCILINGSISMSFKDQERSISFSCYWNQLWTPFIFLSGDKLKMAAIWIR